MARPKLYTEFLPATRCSAEDYLLLLALHDRLSETDAPHNGTSRYGLADTLRTVLHAGLLSYGASVRK